MKSFLIGENEDGIKLFKYLKNIFKEMPDSLIHKLLRKKYFKINDKKAYGNEILKNNDKIFMFLSDDTFNKFYEGGTKDKHIDKNFTQVVNIKKYIDNRIVFEDNNIIIYNKPYGLLSQSSVNGEISVNSILYNYTSSNIKDDDNVNIDNSLIDNDNFVSAYNYRPSILNRLDRNTEGLIIFAKTYKSARLISEMIKNNQLIKHYKTIVNGIINTDYGELINLYKKDDKLNKAIIKNYIDKDTYDGYSIVKLKYQVLKRNTDSTVLDINLITGKSHQIRAQLSFIGHPIICDKKYMDNDLYIKNNKTYGFSHQKLCCYSIKFGVFNNSDLEYLSNKEFYIDIDFN